MSATIPTPESDQTGAATAKPQRVLACVLCTKRKVKCDRKFPCSNCSKSRSQCIPGTQVARRKRRRFPERVLLERLRHYEDLLRQNNVKFEPLHPGHAREKQSPDVQDGEDSDDEQPTTANPEREFETKNIWHAMTREFRDPDNASDSSDDDLREGVVKQAWDQVLDNYDHILFGSPKNAVDISTLHPDPVQIFRLWQLYLENVDPLFKVTHTPTLQGRIIEAASSVYSIGPALEALMFSIYSVATSTISEDDSQAMFSSSKEDLLLKYQFGCQQALMNCSFLRTEDLDCLTALYLYLMSAQPTVDPHSISSLLGIAFRIAQRMRIHSESELAKCTALEAEMRRRLWWSLVLFDARLGEKGRVLDVMLVPTWDCKVPHNVNDSDFRQEMTEAPQIQGTSTDALFAVVRSELGDYIRHTTYHLSFTNPAFKPIAKNVPAGPGESELDSLEKMIEDKYLRYCDLANPLHFMTVWTSRVYIAKSRLLEHNYRMFNSTQTEAQRDAALSYALRMLEGDTNLLGSPLTKRFYWLIRAFFPFPAYLHILQHVKRRPLGGQADHAWAVLDKNFETRFAEVRARDMPFFNMFATVVLGAWEARETAYMQLGESVAPPSFVAATRQRVSQSTPQSQNFNVEQLGGVTDTNFDDLMSAPMDFASQGLFDSTGLQYGNAASQPAVYPSISGIDPLDIDANQLDWSAMDWGFGNTLGK